LKSSRPSKSKDITYVLLKESLEKEDCPTCYLLARTRERWLDSLLYEHVNDSVLRDKIREIGFCTRHIWAMLKYSEEHPIVDGLGISIIVQDVLGDKLSIMLKTEIANADWGKKCILCELLDESEKSYSESFAIWFGGDEFQELYRTSPSIFCMNHLRSLLRELQDKDRKLIMQIHLTKLEKLNRDLKSFIRKFDWTVKEKPTYEEADAKQMAIRALKGSEY